MRIITLLAVFFFSAATAQAQISKGAMLVGGNLEFSSMTDKVKRDNTTDTRSTTTSFSVNPQFGYFIVDNFAVGTGLLLTTSSIKFDGSDSKSTNSAIAINPFVRYYINNFFFHAQGGVGSQKVRTDLVGGVSERKSSFSNIGIGAGYAIFLNDNVAIEPTLKYLRASTSVRKEDGRDIMSGISLSIGIQVYLRK